jgi:hypothetical protein
MAPYIISWFPPNPLPFLTTFVSAPALDAPSSPLLGHFPESAAPGQRPAARRMKSPCWKPVRGSPARKSPLPPGQSTTASGQSVPRVRTTAPKVGRKIKGKQKPLKTNPKTTSGPKTTAPKTVHTTEYANSTFLGHNESIDSRSHLQYIGHVRAPLK